MDTRQGGLAHECLAGLGSRMRFECGVAKLRTCQSPRLVAYRYIYAERPARARVGSSRLHQAARHPRATRSATPAACNNCVRALANHEFRSTVPKGSGDREILLHVHMGTGPSGSLSFVSEKVLCLTRCVGSRTARSRLRTDMIMTIITMTVYIIDKRTRVRRQL